MIAYAMLYAVVVGLPILLAAVVGSAFLRKHGRAERGVWLLALALTLALPVIMLSHPPVAVPTPWTAVLESVAIDLAPVVIVPAVTEAPPVIGIQDILIALWLLASFSLVTRWVVSSVRLARLRRSWHTETLGGVRVSLAPDIGPGVFGIVRPRIVVPSWVATLPDPQRALVLRHEQEHLRGGDHWLAALSRVARILAPWHPIVWLLTSRLGRAMELDCDRRVLQQHPDVATYGATLLLVSSRGSREVLVASAFAESDVSLRRRILAMTTPPRTLSAVGLALATGLGAVLLTGALEVPVPALDAPAVGGARPLQVPATTTRPVSGAVPASETTATTVLRQVPQQQLREPRVIANPLVPRMVASILQPGPGPGIRVVGDSITYTIVGEVLLGPQIVGFEMARAALAALYGDSARWAIGTVPPRPSWPGPETTVAPRILNPDEIAAAIAQHYPLGLRVRGLGGTVEVQFLVGQTGAVQQTRVGQISAYPELDEAALRVADAYRFLPALLGEGPIAVWVSHAVDFRVP